MPAIATSTASQAAPASAPLTTIYYDGSCPLCTKEISYYQGSGGKDRLAFVDVSGEGPAQVAPDLDRHAAMKRFHVRRADGRLVSGTAAFGTVWQQIPGWQVAGRLAQMPGIRHVGDLVYWQYLRFRPGLQAWEKVLAESDKRRKEKRDILLASMNGTAAVAAPSAPVVPAARLAALAASQTAAGAE